MQKLITAAALLLAMAAPAQAVPLTSAQVADLVQRIKYRYVPMGLTATEITVIVRDLYNTPYVVYTTNDDGSISFMYEDRPYPGGPVTYLGLIYRAVLQPQAAPVLPAAPNHAR